MFRYSAKIRLGGSVLNEVRRSNMSAAEIMILRRLHGNDAVVEIVESKKSDKSVHEVERANLQKRFCSMSERRSGFSLRDFAQMFGPDHAELPARLPDLVRKEALEANPPQPSARTRLKNNVDATIGDEDIVNIAG